MPSKTLSQYIESELAKGNTPEDIKMRTIAAGWPPTMVDQALGLHLKESEPEKEKALSLKKRSWLVDIIRLGFGFLTLSYFLRFIVLAAVIVIMSRSTAGIKAALPFDFLKIIGWQLPAFLFISSAQTYVSLWSFLKLPRRTRSVWLRSLITLVVVFALDLVIAYLYVQMSQYLNTMTNSY